MLKCKDSYSSGSIGNLGNNFYASFNAHKCLLDETLQNSCLLILPFTEWGVAQHDMVPNPNTVCLIYVNMFPVYFGSVGPEQWPSFKRCLKLKKPHRSNLIRNGQSAIKRNYLAIIGYWSLISFIVFIRLLIHTFCLEVCHTDTH